MSYTKVKSVPPAEYVATLTKVEEKTHKEYGAGVTFEFTICQGEFSGQTVFRTCKPILKASTNFGKFSAKLAGCGFADLPDEFDPEKFVGQQFVIEVAETDSGGAKVERIVRKAKSAEGESKTGDDVPF